MLQNKVMQLKLRIFFIPESGKKQIMEILLAEQNINWAHLSMTLGIYCSMIRIKC